MSIRPSLHRHVRLAVLATLLAVGLGGCVTQDDVRGLGYQATKGATGAVAEGIPTIEEPLRQTLRRTLVEDDTLRQAARDMTEAAVKNLEAGLASEQMRKQIDDLVIQAIESARRSGDDAVRRLIQAAEPELRDAFRRLLMTTEPERLYKAGQPAAAAKLFLRPAEQGGLLGLGAAQERVRRLQAPQPVALLGSRARPSVISAPPARAPRASRGARRRGRP